VLDCLARARAPVPARERTLTGTRTAGGPAPIEAVAAGGPPWSPRLDTVEFLKERVIGNRHVYAIGFEADHPRAGRVDMTMIARAERVTGLGWVGRGVSTGTAVGEPEVGEPRLYLGGSWGRFGFCGGGQIYPPAAAVARARLRFADGVELEADAEGGWALFFTHEPVERPDATVELLDGAGDVVATHEWPPRPDLADELRRRIPRG
jgi:hypothetical protein